METRADIQAGARRPTVEPGRRHVTALFCDIVGSTELSTRLDAEDLREVIIAFQQACISVVGRFDAQIARYLGDAVVVFFGYPNAHEDDAHRAVRTGLGILEAIGPLNDRLERDRDVRLRIRVGVHSGLVVGSERATERALELDVIGETPNVAARLQSLAEPNTLVISDATQRLVAGYFELDELGPRRVKGIAEPISVYRVMYESAARSRLDVAAATGLTPLVGRESELDELVDAWRDSLAGNTRTVMLTGDAGIGKSRLVRELSSRVAQDSAAWLTPCQCSAYHVNTALYPIVDVLEQKVLAFEREESVDARLRKLEGWAVTYGLAPAETVPLLAPLFSLPLGERYEPLMLTPQRQRERVIEVLIDTLITRAGQQPLLFVVEDLHWADHTTEEFLTLLIERAAGSRMMVLLTFRPDYQPPWGGPTLTTLVLDRMDSDRMGQLADRVAGGNALPLDVRELIVTKAEGNPLFVEELTKSVLESGLLEEAKKQFPFGARPAMAVPASLEGSLLARLDRLTTGRDIAQLGAVLGRDFSRDLIGELVAFLGSLDEDVVAYGLAELVNANILYEDHNPTGPTYVFKHALIRDAVYGSLLRSRRREYHGKTAEVLATQFPETCDAEPELLAYHYTEAGLHEQAITFWQRAAQREIERSANVEAIAYLNNALGLVAGLAEGVDRTEYELELLVTLGMPLIATRGYASAEVERTYARARDLSLTVGETPQLPNILWGLWVYYLTGGRLAAALEMADQYSELARAHPDDSGLAVEMCQLNGIALFYSGEFSPALAHLQRGSELYDRSKHHAHVFAHGGADTGVALMTHEGLTLWALGRCDSARGRMRGALALARSLSHPFSLAFAYYYVAWFHKLCRDEASALEAASAASGICEEFGFPFWGLSSAVLRGTSLVQHGQIEAGLVEARDSLVAFEATGGLLCRLALRGLLADAYLTAGRAAEGLAAITEAIDGLADRGERWWEPELHRLHGELLRLEQAPDTDVELSFQRALDGARASQAMSWELRAAVSLARLWRDRGEVTPARELLVELDARLTQGRATADRRTARQLLLELDR